MFNIKNNLRKFKYFLIIISTAAITLVHFFVFEKLSPYVVLEELYYIPIFLGTFSFGLRGAILTYIVVSVFYLPFIFAGWSPSFLALMDRLLHLVFTGIFAFFTGFLVDREKKRKQLAEREKFLADIGQVVTSIVHDLKNPLITILSFSRRIRDGKGDVQKSAQTIIDSASVIERLVYDVMDFSKPQRLDLKTEDIIDIVGRACDTCKAKGEKKGISIITDLLVKELTMSVDVVQMQRALVNLIDNAIDASPAWKEVFIRVIEEKDSIIITIKDYGEGMDKDMLENVFVPFYTRKSGGTGLGMSIAKKIIEGHNGRINLKSRPGEGTEVIIVLPYGRQFSGKG